MLSFHPAVRAEETKTISEAVTSPVGNPSTAESADSFPTPNSGHTHSNGRLCFLEVLQAISGKKCARKTIEMLKDVVEISRVDDRIVVLRGNATSDSYARGTEYGDRIFKGLDEAEEKLGQKLGAPGAGLIHNLHKISVQGNHVKFIRTGPEKLVLVVPAGDHFIPVRIKQVELGAIAWDIDMKDGFPKLRNIDGVRAVVRTTGLDLPIDLREFGRRRDKKGNTHLSFGVKSWFPAPVRYLLGLPEVMPFHYVVKRKKNHENHINKDADEEKNPSKEDDSDKTKEQE